MRFSITTLALAISAVASPVPDKEDYLASRDVLQQLKPRACVQRDSWCNWKTVCCFPNVCKSNRCAPMFKKPVHPMPHE
ncbi:uncharacterized protein LY79DRAFT_559546 [Colletotrichum navitas]|uniref:Uncharacterized protein n=1 Tax=Colletotrichum navitas TaxID=681940 RepID=A0AAD8PUQ3_9PEZI|nr:uncharacterized protein LY79DRAFT_559546 [Colletotrichum navitas]KAK1585020.1 hypothetical protein LY79DRAFT_559546 [Colletotrichum navitas]